MSLIVRFALHALACLALPFLFMHGYDAWAKWVAAPVARGISLGLAMELIFYVFVGVNVLMAVFANKTLRYGLAGLMSLAVLVYLLPQHPIRGPGIALLCGGLCALAVVLTDPLERLVRRFAKRLDGHPKGPN